MAKLKDPYIPAKNQLDKKVQWFFRVDATPVAYRVLEKQLQCISRNFHEAIIYDYRALFN